MCHGDKGDGNTRVRQGLSPPPLDFTSPDVAETLTRERMIDAVRDGKPGTAMVGWKTQLTDAQIAAIVDFIRDRFMRTSNGTGSQAGREIYATTCSVCHGEEGAGAVWGQSSLNPPPVDFTNPLVQSRLTRERMIVSVTHGRPGTAMAAFGTQLQTEDIAAVVDYIRTDFMGIDAGLTAHAATQPTPGKDLAMPFGLTGDPAIGRAFYLQNCTACHGARGDGNGPRAYFIFPKPRNFLHPAARAGFNRPKLYRAIKDGVVGREMPAWGKVLDDQKIAHIAEYVYQAFIRPDDAEPAAK